MSVVKENEEVLKVTGGYMYKKCEDILNDLEKQGKIKKLNFTFPPKQELKLKLKDILEDNVDEKYYLSDEQVNKIKYSKVTQDLKDPKCVEVTRKYGIFDTDKSTHQAGSVYDENGLAPTLDTMQGGWRQPCIEIKNNTKKGYLEANDGDGCYITNIDKKRGTVQKEMIPTLKTSPDIGVCVGSTQKNAAVSKNGICPTLTSAMGQGGGHVPMHNYNLRIRKLTPKETWRLMGFDDEDFDKAAKVNSNTQLYKQAGNSIVVNVLEAIFKELFNNRLWSDLD